MSVGEPSGDANQNVRTELKAAIAARRELGPDMEDEVLANFLARIDQHIDERLAQQQAARPRRRSKPEDTMGGSMALSIPLIVVAGIFGHGFGIAVVVLGLVLINLMYVLDRRLG
jgi:hypothetical protein